MAKKILNALLNVLLVILSIVFVCTAILKIGFTSVTVNGNSMYPTIENNSVGYMVKVSKSTKIERFDVVATSTDVSDYNLIKRVLGLPNEEVTLKDNVLTVNGEVIEQTFTHTLKANNFKKTSFSLGEDEYLIVGDNRAITIEPAVVTKDEIFGKNGFCYKIVEDNNVVRKWYLFKDGREDEH